MRVPMITDCYVGRPDRNSLLLGYGGRTLDEIERGTTILIHIIRRRG